MKTINIILVTLLILVFVSACAKDTTKTDNNKIGNDGSNQAGDNTAAGTGTTTDGAANQATPGNTAGSGTTDDTGIADIVGENPDAGSLNGIDASTDQLPI